MSKHRPAIDWGQGRIDQPRATVSVFTPSELASPVEKARLFAALEKFANLDDTFEAYRGFLVQWPTFLPAVIKHTDEDNPEPRPVDWSTPECHKLVLVYQGVLKRLWQNDQEALSIGLGSFLLGIDSVLGSSGVSHIPGLDRAWSQLGARYPRLQIERPSLFTHWGSGTFFFNPLTDFQRAAYILFRESWRAKVCPCCYGFFIAHRAPQIYCSSRCYGMTKQRRGLDWWRQHGSEWRAGRNKAKKGLKTSAKKSQKRKRGK
jgi:hypothetical protein